MDLDIPTSPVPVEDVLAARRAKRQAILAKYKGLESIATSVSSSPGPSSAVQPPPSLPTSNSVPQTQPTDRSEESAFVEKFNLSEQPGEYFKMSLLNMANVFLGRRDSMSVSPTPRDFTLAKDEGHISDGPSEQAGADQFLAADYDPSLDRREDEHKRFNGRDLAINVEEEEEVEEEVEEEEEEEDIDDMFAVALADKPKIKKVKKVKVCCLSCHNWMKTLNLRFLETSCSCSDYDFDA
jgi:serine/threonine-protein kinase PRP4